MDHINGQVAEYGSQEFENHKSVLTILESAILVNPHGIRRKIELYHRTEGYKPAGSCAIWTKESYGYRFYNSDGTTGGYTGCTYDFIMGKWVNLPLVERQIVAE